MKIMCNVEVMSDYDFLCSLAGSDTWIKVHPNNELNDTEYIQVLYVFEDGFANVLSVAAECVDDEFVDNPNEAFDIYDVFECEETYDLHIVEVVRPIETLPSREIRLALSFNGYNDTEE